MRAFGFVAAACAVGLGVAVAPAVAATLNMNVTADNQFSVYISSSNNTLGTLVLSGTDWATTYSNPSVAISGTEYIHVIVTNWDPTTGWPDDTYHYGAGTPYGNGNNPAAFIGTFGLTGGTFSNGSTTLSTDTTDWTAAAVYPSGTPPYTQSTLPAWAHVGLRNSDIIRSKQYPAVGRTRSDIASGADWIWSDSTNYDYAEFSTKVTSDVPEASTWTMLLGGFGALAFASLRWSRKRDLRSLAG